MEFNGKIDQLAFISHSERDTQAIKQQLGLHAAEWVEDICVASGEVRGVPGVNKARLLFNYDMGIEVEILQYLEGPNYASQLQGGRIAHFGIHADSFKVREGYAAPPVFDAPIIQRVKTRSHTNPFLVETGRRYQYTIYDTLLSLGVFTKVIERIEQ
jgi:hypothetical protein